MSTIYSVNFIDANILDEIKIDETEDIETNAVKSIVQLKLDGHINLIIPFSVKKELEHANTPLLTKVKASDFLFSDEIFFEAHHQIALSQVEKILKGNCIDDKHKKDALHVYESSRNSGRYFITKDKRILKKSHELKELLSIKIVKPSDFLYIYLIEKGLSNL
jgi:hypothetical protein